MEIGVEEKCVRCGKETAYDQSTPVDMRRWYVEGSGQLCEACWLKLWPIHKEENISSVVSEGECCLIYVLSTNDLIALLVVDELSIIRNGMQ